MPNESFRIQNRTLINSAWRSDCSEYQMSVWLTEHSSALFFSFRSGFFFPSIVYFILPKLTGIFQYMACKEMWPSKWTTLFLVNRFRCCCFGEMIFLITVWVIFFGANQWNLTCILLNSNCIAFRRTRINACWLNEINLIHLRILLTWKMSTFFSTAFFFRFIFWTPKWSRSPNETGQS